MAETLPIVIVARVLGFGDDVAPDLKQAGYAQVELISGFVPDLHIPNLEQEGIHGLAPVIEADGEALNSPEINATSVVWLSPPTRQRGMRSRSGLG